ncbi:MAG: hypothetical protein M1829_000017 [Trizodia sp. TS-e1964]|nr:MAG: hypothetical protein M1829_000017 [Trizodia sp. TS-e1964]
MSSPPSLSALNASSVSSWDANAAFWDAHMADKGNEFFALELAAIDRLLGACLRPGVHALDLATGNGLMARFLAGRGAHVIATDASEKMLELARQRVGERVEEVRFLDVTLAEGFEEVLAACKERHGPTFAFDIVTMNMGIMDVPTLSTLSSALPRLLKPGGKFLATILHPSFLTPGAHRLMEMGEDPLTARFGVTTAIKVSAYLAIPPTPTEALFGQPRTHLYFHRPLHAVLRPFLQAGLLLDGLEEPGYGGEKDTKKIQSFANFQQIPVVMAFSFRNVGAGGVG